MRYIFEVGLKANQKVVGYSHNIYVSVAPVEISHQAGHWCSFQGPWVSSFVNNKISKIFKKVQMPDDEKLSLLDHHHMVVSQVTEHFITHHVYTHIHMCAHAYAYAHKHMHVHLLIYLYTYTNIHHLKLLLVSGEKGKPTRSQMQGPRSRSQTRAVDQVGCWWLHLPEIEAGSGFCL